VFDAVVVGLPDNRWGERVTAVVSLRDDGAASSAGQIIDFCRQSLASYKVPRHVVVVDAVVRSPSGKPDYRWARETAGQATST
jgi:acyl-CoA synthetase (AMP-forming)/AMP-acid ligase II